MTACLFFVSSGLADVEGRLNKHVHSFGFPRDDNSVINKSKDAWLNIWVLKKKESRPIWKTVLPQGLSLDYLRYQLLKFFGKILTSMLRSKSYDN